MLLPVPREVARASLVRKACPLPPAIHLGAASAAAGVVLPAASRQARESCRQAEGLQGRTSRFAGCTAPSVWHCSPHSRGHEARAIELAGTSLKAAAAVHAARLHEQELLR